MIEEYLMAGILEDICRHHDIDSHKRGLRSNDHQGRRLWGSSPGCRVHRVLVEVTASVECSQTMVSPDYFLHYGAESSEIWGDAPTCAFSSDQSLPESKFEFVS